MTYNLYLFLNYLTFASSLSYSSEQINNIQIIYNIIFYSNRPTIISSSGSSNIDLVLTLLACSFCNCMLTSFFCLCVCPFRK